MDQAPDVDFGLLQPSASKDQSGISGLLKQPSVLMGARDPALEQPTTNRIMAIPQQHKMWWLVHVSE